MLLCNRSMRSGAPPTPKVNLNEIAQLSVKYSGNLQAAGRVFIPVRQHLGRRLNAAPGNWGRSARGREPESLGESARATREQGWNNQGTTRDQPRNNQGLVAYLVPTTSQAALHWCRMAGTSSPTPNAARCRYGAKHSVRGGVSSAKSPRRQGKSALQQNMLY